MNAPLIYGLQLSLHNLKRTPLLTLSIVITLALGISTSMTAVGLLHVLTADPIPSKSRTLYQPKPVSVDQAHSGNTVSFSEATALVGYKFDDNQATLLSEGIGPVESQADRPANSDALVLHTTRSFFPMFNVPFSEGGVWSKSDDLEGNHVAVIGKALARKLFGQTPKVVGQAIRYGGAVFRVVGVLEEWRQTPRIYNLATGGAWMESDDLYVPIKAVRDLDSNAFVPFDCDEDKSSPTASGDAVMGHNDKLFNSRCQWVSMWVELPTKAQYDQFLGQMREHEDGNFHYVLSNVPTLIRDTGIIPVDVKIYSLLGLGFLVLCVLSSSGALLGKFFRQSFETGLRRALGASQRDIQFEFLTESLLIGVLGGLLGLALTWVGFVSVRQLQTPYAEVAHLDETTLFMTILISIASGILAGYIPAWRAARISPGILIRR
jgi:putative ABC transport system permease protein